MSGNGPSSEQPRDADLTIALQLAAKAALDGEQPSNAGVPLASAASALTAGGTGTLTASAVKPVTGEVHRENRMQVGDMPSSSCLPAAATPFANAAGQQGYPYDPYGRRGSAHARQARRSIDSAMPYLNQRRSRRSSTDFTNEPVRRTSTSWMGSRQGSFGPFSNHGHAYSQGVSAGWNRPMSSSMRKSIEVVRPSSDRLQVEHAMYEDIGPPTIIRDADGQEYLIQPIRESLDQSGQCSQSVARRSSAQSGSTPERPRAGPIDLQSLESLALNKLSDCDLSTPFSNVVTAEDGTLTDTGGARHHGTSRGSMHDAQPPQSTVATELSRMTLCARPMAIDENKDYVEDTAKNDASERMPSGTHSEDRSTTNPTNSGASGSYVGQMYLNSLRYSAPISIGVSGGNHQRYSAGDIYNSHLFAPSDTYGGSRGTSSDNLHDLLDPHSDAYAEYTRYGDTRLSDVEWEIDIHDIHFGPRIGRGAYGEVFKCVYRETDVAVKLFIEQDVSEKVLEAFRKEVNILKKLRHPNILHFMGYCTVPPHMCIVTEYEPNGSLFKLLHRSNVQLDDGQKLKIAMDVAIGMHYLHTSRPPIVHGDLKSPNLLLDDHLTVKICDFGLSRFRMATKLSAGSKLGTPEWTAPEVLQSSRNSEAGDVYSYGVVLWEIFTGQIPWEDVSAMQVVLMVGFHKSRLAIPENIPTWAKELIESCFNDADERPSFAEIINKLRDVKAKLVDPRGVSRNGAEGV